MVFKKYATKKGGEMLLEYLSQIFSLLLQHKIDKVEKEITEHNYIYRIKAYWVMNTIRIDIQPIKKEEKC